MNIKQNILYFTQGDRSLSLPNIISFSRICFIPPFVICLIQVQQQSVYRYVALGMLFIMGLSDILDGYLARKMGQITLLGKYLDLIADKLILIITCLILSSDKLWPGPGFPNWVLVIIISRELLIILGYLSALVFFKRKVECCPNTLGKLTAFLQIITIMAVLLGNHISITALIILWWLMSVVTFASAVNYAYRGVKQLYHNRCIY